MSEAQKSASKRILIVTHDSTIRKSLQSTLQMKGYITMAADESRVANAMAISFKPELVIMDMLIPERAAMKALCEILEDNKEVKAIVLTGQRENILSSLANMKGFDEDRVVCKLLDIRALIETIKKLIG